MHNSPQILTGIISTQRKINLPFVLVDILRKNYDNNENIAIREMSFMKRLIENTLLPIEIDIYHNWQSCAHSDKYLFASQMNNFVPEERHFRRLLLKNLQPVSLSKDGSIVIPKHFFRSENYSQSISFIIGENLTKIIGTNPKPPMPLSY